MYELTTFSEVSCTTIGFQPLLTKQLFQDVTPPREPIRQARDYVPVRHPAKWMGQKKNNEKPTAILTYKKEYFGVIIKYLKWYSFLKVKVHVTRVCLTSGTPPPILRMKGLRSRFNTAAPSQQCPWPPSCARNCSQTHSTEQNCAGATLLNQHCSPFIVLAICCHLRWENPFNK